MRCFCLSTGAAIGMVSYRCSYGLYLRCCGDLRAQLFAIDSRIVPRQINRLLDALNHRFIKLDIGLRVLANVQLPGFE